MRNGRLFGPKTSLLAMILLDVGALAVSSTCVVTLRYVLGGDFSPRLYQELYWTISLYFCIAASMGVYPGYLRTPPEELKLLSWSTSLFFLVITSLTFLSRNAESYSRSIFLCSWFLALCALPTARMLAKRHLGRFFSWGYPCVLIGGGEGVRRALKYIRQDRRDGLWPLAVATEDRKAVFGNGNPIPLVSFEELQRIAATHPQCHAILVASETDTYPEPKIIEWLGCRFNHVLIASPKIDRLSIWVRGVDIGGGTFLKTYFKLLDSSRLRVKRFTDILLCLLGYIAVLPLIGLIALGIKLDSPGPIFFRQARLGRKGKEFKIIKFRTMHCDAQHRLQDILAEKSELATQWRTNQKLEHDPRITRVGRFLRITSLDELPQFFNVIGGTMSLVGPRPIVAEEIEKYGKEYEIYKLLRPGVTGLWQVSGRNRTTYRRRVELDIYYIRNWSVWMDIWIIFKTIREVFCCNGK